MPEPSPAQRSAPAGDPAPATATREAVLGLIRERPGVALREILCESGHGRGTIEYHLYELERNRQIQTVRVGRTRRYFVVGLAPIDILRVAVLRHERASEIARVVAQSPGIIQRDLTERLPITRKVLRSCISILTKAGLLEERRVSAHRHYYPTPSLRDALQRVEGPSGRRPPGGDCQPGTPP